MTLWFNEMFVLKPRVTALYIENHHFRSGVWNMTTSSMNNSDSLIFVWKRGKKRNKVKRDRLEWARFAVVLVEKWVWSNCWFQWSFASIVHQLFMMRERNMSWIGFKMAKMSWIDLQGEVTKS
jgi:hypothetical protein